MNCKNNGMWKFLAGMAVFISCSTIKPAKSADTMPETKQQTATADTAAPPAFIESLLMKYPQYFDEILKNRDNLNVQIMYTQINRRADGTPDLTNHYFNVNPAKYFYPASTVKLPIVLLALQKLNELKL
jgi:beta-lactamase class A